MTPEEREKRVRHYLANYSVNGFVSFGIDRDCLFSCRGWDGHNDKCECGAYSPYWQEAHGDVFPTVD